MHSLSCVLKSHSKTQKMSFKKIGPSDFFFFFSFGLPQDGEGYNLIRKTYIPPRISSLFYNTIGH